jgi:hypothetical protein
MIFDHLRDYNDQWTFITLAMALLFAALWIRPKFGAIPAALYSVAACSAIWIWVSSENRYVPTDLHFQTTLKLFSADAMGKIMLICMPLMLLSENENLMRKVGQKCALVFVVANSALTLVALLRGCFPLENQCNGVIGNPSIGMGVTVAMLPIIITSWRREWPLLALVSLAVLASKSSIALGLLIAYATMWLMIGASNPFPG